MHMRKIFLGLLASAGLVAITVGNAAAVTGPWAENDRFRARIVVPTDGKTPSSRFELGVELDIADGWRLPWRQVTAYGPAFHLTWFGTQITGTTDLERPAPGVTQPHKTVGAGYGGRVTFPVTVKVRNPRKTVMVNVQVELVLCNTNGCERSHVTAPLQVRFDRKAQPDAAAAKKLETARDRVPERTGGNIGKLKVASREDGAVTSVRFIPSKEGWDMSHWVHLRHEDVTFGQPHAVDGRNEIAYPVIDGKLKPGDRIDVVRLAGNLSRKQTLKLTQDPSFMDRVTRFISMTGPNLLGY